MGITNLCKFLDFAREPSLDPAPFDSILVDAQSYLYVAIELCLQNHEQDFFRELCVIVWRQLDNVLQKLFSFDGAFDKDLVTVVVSLDGDGVPMKWPTQRKRRSSSRNMDRKTIYSCSLFGDNVISASVKKYLAHRFKKYSSFGSNRLKVVLSGADVPGEGEHKVFQIAEALGCRRPIVVSVDQDVFILALWRLERYETIQVFRYDRFYDVTLMAASDLPYPTSHLKICSFLFGNDFVPPVVSISPTNGPALHSSLSRVDDCTDDSADDSTESVQHEARVMARFLEGMSGHLRHHEMPHVEWHLVVAFWTTYLWVADYYRFRTFAQKFLTNEIFDEFDRNQIFTALLREDYSSDALSEARRIYETASTETLPRREVISRVFTDATLLEKVKAYLSERDGADGSCKVFRLTKRPR